MQTPNNQDAPSTGSKRPSPKPLLPTKHVELLGCGQQALKSWKLYPDLKLVYITEAEFEDLYNHGVLVYTQRVQDGGVRQTTTSKLDTMDIEIDESEKTLKTYIAGVHGNEAKARPYYAMFGIVSDHGHYGIPIERSSRLHALKLISTAIVGESFANNTLGTAYWNDLYIRYRKLLEEASGLDSAVSLEVGVKNFNAKMMRKVLKSLNLIIQGNYPDDYKSIQRAWGLR